MYDVYAAQKSDNLRKIYLTIREKTNEILSKYDDINYMDAPAIDINILKTITTELGIKEILYVPPEKIHNFHAILDDSNKTNVVILVNEKDSKEEQLFSIAHEIEHYIKKKADMLKKADIFKKADFEKKADVLKKADVFINPNDLASMLAARGRGIIDKKAIRYVKKIKGVKSVASYIVENVSMNLGKRVSIKKTYKELANVLFVDSIRERIIRRKSNEHFILNMINRLYDEEMADYFAANLLVPTERFILWEDKSDSKIAKAFKVPKACIKKRREEIKHELKFITSENISFGDENRISTS
jgi:Zn-dependent peptidase ImmA (M78 family)